MVKRSQEPGRAGQFIGDSSAQRARGAAKAGAAAIEGDPLECRLILRSAMLRKNISYKQLARMLSARGIETTERNLISRISRGTFTMAFAIVCMREMGYEEIDIRKR